MSHKKKKKKNGVPDRWLDYCPVGRRIPGTRFIAFKVPLKPSLNSRVAESDSFSLWELLDSVQSQNQELGLIIDLTFTTKYYQLSDVPQTCCYVKILTEGRRVPPDAAILSFKQVVTHFLNENRDNDKLIGVHCTHGLNRTGYLVCRYLIDVDGLEPEAAVELFNACRGHRIERQNYLLDLQQGAKRSNAGIDQLEQEPSRGLAVERVSGSAPTQRPPSGPTPTETPTDPTEETQTPGEKRPPGNRRRRGARHRRGNKPPQSGLLPTPPLSAYQWSPAPS
ncbi:RNA/RNP complex-1-interacting phosphatase-like [Thunnus albacares]|uniref:RNA/RNP complex-1-interacting phosphatase-like n=1 Tax=Thunnus maccoyii TaxID=8240 RepID=UPI001C4DBE4C|nr:RNA/RNP complex-1-interacting phosphatase-like [Thunnus maccoyii]XP_042291841.1 RNA/RNP complex-1-interacting phosphatase-like [Thunnus maccoyii]XP_044192115.1 RNA/RNP complex-1-interacting phosphatase-like [Thunnus albacares]XP_044192116.1 RNA/RNP complex-1-interacting phosphatase-like [Thunnus albacares]